LLTGDEEMTELNRMYRQCHRTTDVLSFSQLEGESASLNPQLLGDVIISLPMAARQAKQRGVDLFIEVLFLLVHGVLHLLGFEHVGGSRKQAAEMFREQSRLMDFLLGC
jgi:rRNA maturation RNase YbeY